MSIRKLIIAAGTVLAAGITAAAVIPLASATASPHRVHVLAHLKVLGQKKPACDGSVCTIRNHGDGTMTGYGKVTFTTVITDDTSRPPCSHGSRVPRLVRTIHTRKGDLVLQEAGLVCVQPKVGPRVDLVWVADGARSSGVFAGVHGSGQDHAYLARNTDVPRGTITLGR
jgi:hypothetical protein